MHVDINTYMDTRDHDSNVAGQPNIEPTPLLSGKTTAVTDITEHDILLGRGKSNANHIGNVLFQAMITEHCDSYMNASTQKSKKETCDHIIETARGRFLRFDVDRSCWVEIDHETARTKVAQAFQYRQRRQVQKEAPDLRTHNLSQYDRKRKLSVSSMVPDHSSIGNYQNMRIPQQFELDNSSVTIDEIRWVLGIQATLPQHHSQTQWQQHQHQHPHQQLFHQSSPSPNVFPEDNLAYNDDYAIGMPAAMSSRHSEQIQQLVQPINETNDFLEKMRRSAMSLTAASNDANSTASFLMHTRFQQQAHLMYEQEKSLGTSSAQDLQGHEPSQQRHDLIIQQHLPDCNISTLCPPTVGAIVPTMDSSQSLDAILLRQSINTQGSITLGTANVNADSFGYLATSANEAFVPNSTVSVDFSRFLTPPGIFPQDGATAGNLYDSTSAEVPTRTLWEQNVYPTLQQPFLCDPLQLDENEIAPSNDKVMERMDRKERDRP